MEPVSTLVLVAAFLAPATLTRRLIWEANSNISNAAKFIDEKHTAIALLPGVPTPVTRLVVHKVEQALTLSNREQLKREMKSYSLLSSGWGDANSAIPTSHSMEITLLLIDKLPARLPLPRPMLSHNGELGLYWDLQQGYAELGIERDGLVTFFSRESNGIERTEENLSIASISPAWFWEAIGHLDAALKVVA